MEPWQWAITVIGGLVIMYVPFMYWVGRSIMKDRDVREHALYHAEGQLRGRPKPSYTTDELIQAADRIEKYIIVGAHSKPEKCDTCGK